ncbi:hypothetical protein EKE94_11590 [Mesobaculum littorinae]|uniref:DUF2946 domain-containing protein n=1 Tax=Mesobaculum littorinae TaxID=2486419 RepID=A0A438AHD3_9RHOB|nr:hypothetical protein [Mesobaculum littorinae]RVV98092.1 hypothetical protein EKE94_11590 [Mesobaculum littorinae]
MLRRIAPRLFTLCAILAIAVASALSAAQMAPDRAEAAQAATLAALGIADLDLCGDEAGHDHRCPFCHLLPEPPLSRAVLARAMEFPGTAPIPRGDLLHGPDFRDPAISARAPPRFV